MSVRKLVSGGFYVISITVLSIIIIRFFWINWADLINGLNTGAFSNLGHIVNALLTIPVWFIATMVRSVNVANRVYWILLLLFCITVLLVPASG